ncbi:MAG: YbaB/EbfC family nucleoid-associated protein [Phycisphaerales bacterium]|nr:YbaB/EbfC family nucleoid-associated protein [Phycisphaerales bacterium]
MFDNLKAMGAMAGLMKNKDRLREVGERVKEKMARARVSGQAGGGAARAVVSGQMRVVEIELSGPLVAGMAADDKTRALAGTLIAEAVNSALEQAQRMLQEEISKEARELGLPDLPGLGDLLK